MSSNGQAVCTSFKLALQLLIVALLSAVPAVAANPSFDVKTTPVAGGITNLRTADFDGDGIPDLVGLSYPGIAVLFGDGQGNFKRADLPISGAGAVRLADFDGDRLPDLAVGSN